MNASEISSSVVLLGAVVGALALLWTKVGRKAWVGYRTARAKATAVGDAILGRDAVVDTITGKEIAPALPGIGVRMANQEQQMEAITVAVTRLASHQETLIDHEGRLKALEEASIERVVTKAESAAAFRAIEAVAQQNHVDHESE